MITPPQPQLIWLVSYPKSGNTWLRFLLVNLLYGKPSTATEVDRLIPDIHRLLPNLIEQAKAAKVPIEDINLEAEIFFCDAAIVKTHALPGDRLPLFPYTAGFIYVVRNPLDVIISNLNYRILLSYGEIAEQYNGDISAFADAYIDSFLANKGDIYWQQIQMGTLETHTQKWLDNGYGWPYICIRYEDLSADTRREVRHVCDFLEVAASDAEIDQAIANSSFAEMKKLEEKAIATKEEGMFYLPNREDAIKAGVRFLNKGKSGEGKRVLSAAQIERAKQVFQPIMQKFNYL